MQPNNIFVSPHFRRSYSPETGPGFKVIG
jgi:hypothetical protein